MAQRLEYQITCDGGINERVCASTIRAASYFEAERHATQCGWTYTILDDPIVGPVAFYLCPNSAHHFGLSDDDNI